MENSVTEEENRREKEKLTTTIANCIDDEDEGDVIEYTEFIIVNGEKYSQSQFETELEYIFDGFDEFKNKYKSEIYTALTTLEGEKLDDFIVDFAMSVEHWSNEKRSRIWNFLSQFQSVDYC